MWTPTAKRALVRLPEKVATAVVEFVCGAFADNPQRVGKALRFELRGLYRALRGDFRIIYRAAIQVTILAVEHRADACRQK